MRNKLHLNAFALAIVLFVFAFCYSANAQYDDPRFDRIPVSFTKNIVPKLFAPMAPITIGDYDNFNNGYDYSEGHVSINPRNPLWAFMAYNINGAHYVLNGHDWITIGVTFPNTAGDPVTAYDSLGNLYYEQMKSPVTACWISKSTNGGVNWQTPVSSVVGNDKNWMACDQTSGPYANYVYSTMTPGNFVRSTDFGATYTQTATLSPQSLPGMMVAVGPNGNISGGCVYVVTHSGSNAAGTYNFFCSTNGGLNFTTKSTLSVSNVIGTEVSGRSCVGVMRNRPYPMITADNSWGPYRGRLYLVWASNVPSGSGNKSDVMCKYSTDQGATWSATVTVNDDPNPTANFSFFPAAWCDKETGKLYVSFYDTRRCPTSDSMDVYATYSSNGGVSFAANQRITNAIFKINLPGNTAPAYQGDYFSICSNPKVSIPIWNDFRNASASSIGSFSAFFPDFGMRVTPTVDSIRGTGGDISFYMEVPSVKLYTDTVLVTATITPTPAAGTLTVTYPNTNKLTVFPGNVRIRIQAAGGVTPGNYTLNVTSAGPNGTPVHKRSATIMVGASVTGIENNINVVNKYELSQNYPNPFNPVTRINYNLLKSGEVKFTVYDAVGKQVTTLDLGVQQAGPNFVMFNAGSLSSGVYFYKMQAGEFTDIRKMFLVK
jgi:hypothetical protein